MSLVNFKECKASVLAILHSKLLINLAFTAICEDICLFRSNHQNVIKNIKTPSSERSCQVRTHKIANKESSSGDV